MIRRSEAIPQIVNIQFGSGLSGLGLRHILQMDYKIKGGCNKAGNGRCEKPADEYVYQSAALTVIIPLTIPTPKTAPITAWEVETGTPINV